MVLQNKRYLTVLVAGTLALIVVLSCFAYLNILPAREENLQQLTIGIEPNQTNLLMYIAQNQSYFRENGLNVTLKSYSSGAAAMNSMLKGEVNLASATEFVLARNFLSNNSLQTVGSISKFTHVYIVANKDSGIKTAADLVGRRIGLTLQTNSEFYLGRYLELNNIGLSEVNLTNIPTSQYLNALVNGTVDAVVAWQPYPATIQSELGSDKTLMWDVQSGQPGYEPIISTSNWISQHPGTVKKFITSLLKAQDYLAENPAIGQTIARDELNFTEQYIHATWPNYLFAVSLDQSLLLAMHDEAIWLINNNLTTATTAPQFQNCIYTNGLSAVKPQAVNIIG